jgi:preprotein translocase subunit SecE
VSESSTQTPEQGRSGAKKAAAKKPSLWARLSLFMRQMVAELRKVIWPTRKELITYTWVVIVFVTVVTAIVGVFDYVFAKLVLAVFG